MRIIIDQIKAIALISLFILTISIPALADDVSIQKTESQLNQEKIESIRLLKEETSKSDQTKPGVASQEIGTDFSIVKLFQGLGLCIAVFFVGIHFYKKYVLKEDFKRERQLKMLEKITLNSKSQLCLVEYNQKKLLVGVGSDNISFYQESDIFNSIDDFKEVSQYVSPKDICQEKVN